MCTISITGGKWSFDQPQIMGIINATSDSFFEASRSQSLQQTIDTIGQMELSGASIIDIGGQSTRPGAIMISANEELENILPIVHEVKKHFPKLYISIDTFRAEVAKYSIIMGAHIINDISCGQYEPSLLDIVSQYQSGYIGMHSNATLDQMHQVVKNRNIIHDVVQFFQERKQLLSQKNITDWVIDPGFGFGKSIDENFKLVQQLSSLQTIGLPILLGVSRKSSIYKTLGVTQNEALNGTTVLNTIGLMQGAQFLRVHDVKEAKQAVTLIAAMQK
jgi:dihydropteroate synthase